MGCLASKEEVATKYKGGTGDGDGGRSAASARQEGDNAAALVSGNLAFSSWVEVGVSAADLKAADTFSKSDPMAVLMEQSSQVHGGWVEVGRTEVISNDQDPKFIKKFRLLYNFEAVQMYKLHLVDVDKQHNPETCAVKSCDHLGDVEFRLSDVLTSSNRSVTLALTNTSRKTSKVHLMAEEMSSAREVLTMALCAKGLKNVEVMSKSDPFLQISRSTEAGAWVPVFKTETIDNNLNPAWRAFTIKATQLNNGDPNRPLLLSVYDHEDNGRHRLLGQVETNALKLKALSEDKGSLQLSAPDGTARGEISVSSFSVEIKPTFLDYLQGGAEISFMVAVDYTGSNRDPRDPASLHYCGTEGEQRRTPYEEAIIGIARVLEAYDSDKIFQGFGFGCKPPGGVVQHCAPLGADGTGTCFGIAGVLHAYRHTLYTMALSGPTLFAPLLRTAVSLVRQPTAGLKYHVLLILTDGCIHDMQDTVDLIVEASSLPLSILIVGIGESPELAKMEVLDADKKALVSSRGVRAYRDTVQFVKFSEHRGDGYKLAKELLAELPGQFLEWTKANNILPPLRLPPQQQPPQQQQQPPQQQQQPLQQQQQQPPQQQHAVP
ncbi:hypothetical protein FOA52_006353 [Chlamydomonas sp. UWO 241]|nr:hypothetical protein FOA52_006353 [Chlamydomonas sp. UWO 241]